MPKISIRADQHFASLTIYYQYVFATYGCLSKNLLAQIQKSDLETIFKLALNNCYPNGFPTNQNNNNFYYSST